MLSNRDFKGILDHSLLFAFFAAFIGGLLTSLTPCILPIIPVTLLVIGVQKKGSLLRNFLFSLLFVLGIVATYATLGIVAAAIGINIGFLFQERLFIALLVVFLSL
jgi:thiol:disulfide interchange protein